MFATGREILLHVAPVLRSHVFRFLVTGTVNQDLLGGRSLTKMSSTPVIHIKLSDLATAAYPKLIHMAWKHAQLHTLEQI